MILAATIISALTTSVLYPLIGIGVYAVSIVSFAIAAAYGAFALPKTPIVRESQEEAPLRVLDALRRDSWLVLAMLLFALTQLAFTPFFQMWQMVFLDVGLDPSWFGVIFIAFQLINIASNVAWHASGIAKRELRAARRPAGSWSWNFGGRRRVDHPPRRTNSVPPVPVLQQPGVLSAVPRP